MDPTLYLLFLAVFARNTQSEILTGNTFTCTTNQEFASDQIDCDDGVDCTVNCGSFTECCQSVKINGPTTSGALTITASATNALKSSKIYCPPSPNQCSITVSGNYNDLLSNAEIYSKNGFNDLSLTCNHVSGVSNCYSASNPAQLHCQSDYGGVCSMSLESGTTNWQCDTDGINLCNDATDNGYYGSYHECNTDGDCYGQTHYCNENENCVVHCDHEAAGGRWSCRNGRIYGPTTGHMTVTCHGFEACWDAIIYGPTTGDLTVTCRVSQSCWELRVYCPINGVCSISASGSGGKMIKDLRIYTVDGLDNLDLSCEYASTRSSNCYTDGGEPYLYCGGDYSGSCRVLLQSGYDVWACATGTVCTGAPTRDPTPKPTNKPSTMPSSAPSDDPTPAPTFDPTGAPSRSPSSAPSAHPSTAPSSPPTRNPSSAPSRNPTTAPTANPTESPSSNPSNNPTFSPTVAPSRFPSFAPSNAPFVSPSSAPTNNPTNHPTINPSAATNAPSVRPTVTPTRHPATSNAVVTNYEILIAIKNCDDEDGDHQGSSETCALDTDVIDEIVDSVQDVDDHVDVVSAGVVDDDLVIRISITTDPTKVLQSDVVRSHVEKEVRDNDDFGDVDVEEKDSQFNDLNNNKEDAMAGFIDYLFVDNLLTVVASVGLCCCGICVMYFFCQQRKTQKELMKLVQMSSVDPSSENTNNRGETGAQEEETNNRGEGAGVGGAGDDTVPDTFNVVDPRFMAMQMHTAAGVVPLSMPLSMPPVPVGLPEPPQAMITADIIDDNADTDDSMYDNDDGNAGVYETPAGNPGHVVNAYGTGNQFYNNAEPVLCTPQNE